ncbi:MAG: four helix bundle protein [Candidatus Kerfeldbacteria bacterium]|nr:four helix bundle protein [Candidatus Kerfeldbacteria bacterium]
MEDLKVYQKLFNLVLDVHKLTMLFPKFELYELGSQLRRSSNSAAANLAECFANKHTNIYAEGISRAQGEIRETRHHLHVALKKGYLELSTCTSLTQEYEECSKMLYRLEASLLRTKRR